MFNDPYLLPSVNIKESRLLLGKIIRIKDEISPDLAFRASVLDFFRKVEKTPEKEVQVDFADVLSISRSIRS